MIIRDQVGKKSKFIKKGRQYKKMANKVRIRMYGYHLGYISADFYNKFKKICDETHYGSWIKKKAKEDFKIKLECSQKIEELRKIVVKSNYEDICDWLREKMREDIKKVKIFKDEK